MAKKLPILMSFIVFIVSSSFYFFDCFIQVIPSLISQNLKQSFDMDAGELGLLASIFFLSYTCMQIPAGLLYDRFGGRRVIVTSAFVATMGIFLFSTANNMFLASISRLLMGAGASSAFLGALYFALRWFPAHYFATLAGLVALIGSLGAITSNALILFLLDSYSWRMTLSIVVFIGLTITVLLAIFCQNQPFEHANNVVKPSNHFSLKKELKYCLTHKQLWGLSFYCFFNWSIVTGFAVLWGIPFLERVEHLSSADASGAIALLWLGIGLGSPVTGFLSDLVKRRRIPLVSCALLATILFIILIFTPNLSDRDINTILFLLGVAASGPTIAFAAVKDIIVIDAQNLANGLVNMMAVLSGLAMQPLIGYMMNSLWLGKVEAGVSVYSALTYKLALCVLPLTGILSLIIAIFWIKESHPER